MDKDLKDLKSFGTKSGASSTKSGSTGAVVKTFDSAPSVQSASTTPRSLESFAQEYVQKLVKLEEAVKAEDHTYAKKLCNELLALYPDMVSVQYYSYVLEGVDAVYEAYKKHYGSSRAVEQFKEDDMESCLRVFIEEIAEAKGDLERAYHGYRALKNNAKAKYTRYKQGEKAFANGKYEQAIAYFRDAEDYRDAPQRIREIQEVGRVKSKFDQQVGNKTTYMSRMLHQKMPQQMQQFEQMKAKKFSKTFTEGFMFNLCITLMMISSIVMCFDPGFNMPYLYFGWGICATIALHIYNVWDFRLILSCLCAFGLSMALPMLRLFVGEIIGTQIPFMLAGVAVSAIVFVKGMKNERAYRAYKANQDALEKLFNEQIAPEQERLRTQLINEYKSQTMEYIVKEWVKQIPDIEK